MADVILKNDELTVEISYHGAELRSVKDNKTGYEYMWQADPEFWGRTSPVLFPVVGQYKDKESIYEGVTYTLGQHGFARDMEFVRIAEPDENQDSAALFMLTDSVDTLKVYPFRFRLFIKYVLSGRSIKVMWKVVNINDKKMYFSIGAHPAFNCDSDRDSLIFDTNKDLKVNVLSDKGVLSSKVKTVEVTDSQIKMSAELFSEDALIIEDEQIHEVTVAREDGTRLVKVSFTAPLCGIWSPVGKNAPFVCIEPWYGRADREDFSKKLEEREYGNVLEPDEAFEAEYDIEFLTLKSEKK